MPKKSENIRVKEVNKYLSPLIRDLKLKHVKVTNPDFEKELAALTGIGWKQVKNYQNHPNPNQVLNDNSKVRAFVLKKRSLDTSYRLKEILFACVIIVLILICLFSINFLIYHKGDQNRELEKLINKRIQEMTSEKSLFHCEKTSSKFIDCPEGRYHFKD